MPSDAAAVVWLEKLVQKRVRDLTYLRKVVSEADRRWMNCVSFTPNDLATVSKEEEKERCALFFSLGLVLGELLKQPTETDYLSVLDHVITQFDTAASNRFMRGLKSLKRGSLPDALQFTEFISRLPSLLAGREHVFCPVILPFDVDYLRVVRATLDCLNFVYLHMLDMTTAEEARKACDIDAKIKHCIFGWFSRELGAVATSIADAELDTLEGLFHG